jgi:hypothetical protein
MSPAINPKSPPERPRPQPPPSEQRRRHPRLELAARCFLVDGEHTFYLRVHDVSAGGLSVRAPVPFRAARPIDVRLELPGGATVRARCVIVWVRPEGGESPGAPRMGARFLEFVEGEEDLYKLVGRA